MYEIRVTSGEGLVAWAASGIAGPAWACETEARAEACSFIYLSIFVSAGMDLLVRARASRRGPRPDSVRKFEWFMLSARPMEARN